VAQGSPVSLKSTLGQGYTIQATFRPSNPSEKQWVPPSSLLDLIRPIAPMCYVSSSAPHQASFHLMLKDSELVEKVLEVLESNATSCDLESYDVLGTSIEDIFLDLMSKEQSSDEIDGAIEETKSAHSVHSNRPLELGSGRKRSPFSQASTIFYKRVLVARRSWLTPFLAVLVVVAGSCIPLFFLPKQQLVCTKTFKNTTSVPLYLPFLPTSILPTSIYSNVLTSPPNATNYLGPTGATLHSQNITDNSTFFSDIKANYLNITLGGVSIDFSSGNSLIAWEASPPGINGPTLLNLASNILYNAALNTTSTSGASIIGANYASFPAVSARTLVDLKWVSFFGASMVCCRLQSSSNLS
jgi:ATP-binding cassette, subfamily A (ABC1), member 3